jgi:uncharacterized protein
MKPHREHNPRRLDVAAFCDQAGTLQGQWPLAEFDRLLDGTEEAGATAPIEWQADGSTLQRVGSKPEHRLRLTVRATVWRQCQRCLTPMALAVDVQRQFRFAATEDEAARLDEDDEDEDVLVLSRSFDLHDLVEDELLLALPIVPMHETCPLPVVMSAPAGDDEAAGEAPAHPFAALAALKKTH